MFWIRILLILLCLPSAVYGASSALLLEIKGPIGPATQDYITRGIESATSNDTHVIVIQLDTPGGLETSMRGINKAILGSHVRFCPVLL